MNLQFKNNTQKLTLVAICVALVVVLSQIMIPMPSGIPVTLQTFGVALVATLLGAKLAPLCLGVYVALGAVGVPVFAGFGGGLASIIGPTGGFIWGFIAMAFLCGLGSMQKNKILTILLSMAGLLVCHIFGALQYGLLNDMNFLASMLLVSIPYLLKDIISVVLAIALAQGLVFALKKAKVFAV